ncbi:hypothetical protein BDB00DRAFT_422018 [Zychaea mexicana]|uniref:uncharacterized protein n=1 Tax=Zychaea mexicana TaxID=64656 RepID=UPI0022FE0179|nr:uncharacterized protein BDB00DRAFT_422018 [Zychaea mexicana]KAI9492715.1 hypothetical protein BDB00DRAFT_422018 [Zychaea mexicana]
MNTFSSSSSAATHSPQPADLDPLAFSTASSMQQPPSVSPCPSSSLHAGHHVSLQQPSETYDHDSANTNSNVSITAINTSNTNTSANTTSSKNALTRISSNPVVATTSTVVTTTTVVPPMLHDYWHGQTPLLLHNDPLRGDLDSVEVNHSERGIAGFVSKLYQSLQAPDDGQKYARWCKHDGKDMFIIECIPKFTEVVLPRLFKHCKFASFVRQLNVNIRLSA